MTLEHSEQGEYKPSVEQVDRLEVLKQLVTRLEETEVNYAIVGGYGLDGLYGELTRDHGDIDMLLDQKDLEQVRSLLPQLGFEFKETKTAGGEVHMHISTNTKLELGTPDMVAQYADAPEVAFLPVSTNASLEGTPFRTATLEGFEIMHNIQTKRANEGRWGEYKHTASRDVLIKKIAQR